MKIAIDMQTTVFEKTGIGFYTAGLVKALKDTDHQNEYVHLLPDQSDHDFNSVERFRWDQFNVPMMAKKAKVDLLHQPGFSAPVFFNKPVVVTVHDLIALGFGKEIPLGSRLYFGRWMPFSYRFASHIIADSYHTKKDLLKYLHMDPEKITVVHLAADSTFKQLPENELTGVRKKFGLEGPFVLHLATINPRKNLEFLVRAFARVRTKLDVPTKLVITGKKGWYYDKLFQLVDDLKLGDSVVFTGYVTDEEKVALYNAATVMAFPSLYEGFGFPPLEAMQCGTPVVSSNTSSLPEVVGDAGILLPPTDEVAWADALGRLLSNPRERAAMTEKGLAQAKKFSWERTAKETMAVYERVLNESK